MTTSEHEMPPHLARYLASLTDPGQVAEPPAPTRATPAPEAGQEAGHVDPAAAARWRQAQTELAGLIRAENRALAADPQAAPVLPATPGAWMEMRAAELEQAEPEAGS